MALSTLLTDLTPSVPATLESNNRKKREIFIERATCDGDQLMVTQTLPARFPLLQSLVITQQTDTSFCACVHFHVDPIDPISQLIYI